MAILKATSIANQMKWRKNWSQIFVKKNVGQINVHCGQLKHANEMGICEGKTRVGSHILVVFIL